MVADQFEQWFTGGGCDGFVIAATHVPGTYEDLSLILAIRGAEAIPARPSHRGNGGDAREAIKALIVANAFLETELEKLRAAVSAGYARGQLLPRDRRDGMTKARRACPLLRGERKCVASGDTSVFDPNRNPLGRPGAFSVSATDDGVENCQFCLLNG
jgi:hypothetical protein